MVVFDFPEPFLRLLAPGAAAGESGSSEISSNGPLMLERLSISSMSAYSG